jgi:plasmid stability protein
MAMTLRLTDDEQTALRERAALEGISMQDAARQAIRDYVARRAHQERVSAAATVVTEAHQDALDRLGQ